MALTNYRLQSIALSVLFNRFGFSLIGDLSPVVVLLLVPTIFAGQNTVSAIWVCAHAYGP
ncbi:MAG: DUF418 domain-containing protein [Thermomicrobiales bacterium]